MSANAIETLRDLLANEPEAGRDHKRDMDWCVDCAEWIAENGAAVEALLEAAKRIGETRGFLRDHNEARDALAAAVRRVETGQ